MTSAPKYPLSWRQKRTPMRGTKRARNWRRVYPGLHFENTTWVVVEGPWRQIKRTGSLSWVRVLCSEQHGGCGKEYDRILNTIVRGASARCRSCYLRNPYPAPDDGVTIETAIEAASGTEPKRSD